MAFEVRFHPLAREDLFELYEYVATHSGAERAAGYIARIERWCDALRDMPDRGKPRFDLAPGVRTLAMERRVLIAYRTGTEVVEILRVLYAGRDFSAEVLPPV